MDNGALTQCPACGSLAYNAGSAKTSKIDPSNVTNIIVTTAITQVCKNVTCPNYAGEDLSKPAKVINTFTHVENVPLEG